MDSPRRSLRLAMKRRNTTILQEKETLDDVHLSSSFVPPTKAFVRVMNFNMNKLRSVTDFVTYGIFKYEMGDPEAEVVKLKIHKFFILTKIFICIKLFLFFILNFK